MNQDKSKQTNRKRQDVIVKQLKIIEKQEQKLLSPEEKGFIKAKISLATENIENLIPNKLKSTLNLAFYKGFQLIFEKGNAYIEKTYNKDKIQLEYDLNNYAVDKSRSNRYIKKLDKQSSQSKLFNSSLAAIEGGVLGVLGIGLPDIPLFIAVVIKSINEVALSYGYSYNTDEEKCYILTLIGAAISKEDKKKEWNKKVDQLSAQMDNHVNVEINLEEQMKKTAEVLSEAILTAKFIQGIPLVGVIGGAVNHTVIRKIGKYASLKYKKRYLLQKLEDR
ncbi:EcsC family protein [Anaeromicropila herbilytica]|uniref:EcsC family protein n=1 Tax=Anaeromicropila herbilytica TaxID=2785025 RepID=A0A7R7IDK1_9FIRM|nr:EcsC family protein [Anaeromicropila herbilytica]BCN30098.1 hypothetical protein bsdtb5_13930 [Anaeromicropila herbilytica]